MSNRTMTPIERNAAGRGIAPKVAYGIDDQGLIQAVAETGTTFREAVQMWEGISAKATARLGNGGSAAAIDPSFTFLYAEQKVIESIIRLRWPDAARLYLGEERGHD